LKLFQVDNQAHGSHKRPWKEWGGCNWVLGPWGRRFWPKSGELVGVPGWERYGRGWGAHRRSICALGRGEECRQLAGWWRAGTTTATSFAPASSRLGKRKGRCGRLR
jgi:hypothetical protein